MAASLAVIQALPVRFSGMASSSAADSKFLSIVAKVPALSGLCCILSLSKLEERQNQLTRALTRKQD